MSVSPSWPASHMSALGEAFLASPLPEVKNNPSLEAGTSNQVIKMMLPLQF